MMDYNRCEKILSEGLAAAREKMFKPQNMIKPDYLNGGDRPHIKEVRDFLLTRLREEMNELFYAAGSDNEHCDWYALRFECGDVISFASMLAEYCIIRLEEKSDCVCNEQMPQIACPKCDKLYDDFDGLAFSHCPACGYCSHPAIDKHGDKSICGVCGREVKRIPLGNGIYNIIEV